MSEDPVVKFDQPPAKEPEKTIPVPDPFVPMEGHVSPLSIFENIIKHPHRILFELRSGRKGLVIINLLALAIVLLALYGAMVGMFSGGDQIWKAAIKVSLGALFSGLICVPSMYIFLCLSKAECNLMEAMGFMLGILAMSAILLIGLAPVAWVFTVSTEGIYFMGLMHLLFWGIGTYFGMGFFKSGCMSFAQSRGNYIQIWSLIFIIVTLQMTCTLRPLLGTSQSFFQKEKKFFLHHWFDQNNFK